MKESGERGGEREVRGETKGGGRGDEKGKRMKMEKGIGEGGGKRRI